MFFYTENMEAAWVLGYVHCNALHYNLSDILENQMLPDYAIFMDKIKKIDYLKKPEFCDLSEQGSGPSHPDGVRPLGVIR